MGMSASQGRFLQLTVRKNNIGRELSILSNQKMSLTRDMQKVSKEYNTALNAKILKWSNNGGVSYIDLSYDNLMKPGVMNQNKAYLLTNSDGKIVLDNSYKKYAEMISPNGSSTNAWTGDKRAEILSSLTGISVDKINNYESCKKNVWEAKEVLDSIGTPPYNKAERNTAVAVLLEQFGNDKLSANFDNHNNWACAYKEMDCGTITVNGASQLRTLIDNLGNKLSQYLTATDADGSLSIKKACDTVYNEYDGYFEDGAKLDCPDIAEKNGSTVKLKAFYLIEKILGAYGKNGDDKITWVQPGSDYDDYLSKKQTYDNKKTAATTQYESALLAKGEALTSEEESLLNFYDSMFSAIAEKGWTHNESVKDTEYLNHMLQNNAYTLTSLDREEKYDEETGDYFLSNKFSTDIASNMKNIFSVNDSQVRSDALVDYEYKKSLISAKESRVDLRMQDLQTEQSAISQMIQGIQKQLNDNIERTMNIFSG